jgi:hypothetical protein
MSLQSRLASLITAIGADIKAVSTLITTHKYHAFSNGQYFFDDYTQGNYFRLFTEGASFSTTRFCPITSVEYWTGSAWAPWVGGDVILQNLLDGRANTLANIDHTHKRFRFIVSKNTGWPTTALVVLQSDWTGIAYPSMTMTLEESTTVGGTYTLKDTEVFGAGTTSAAWGTHVKVVTGLHTGAAFQRVEIVITDWVDNGSYVTIPLIGFEIYSNYAGAPQQPWSWDYAKKVYFTALDIGGQAPVLANDARLTGGVAKQVLASNGASVPTWQTLDLTYLPDAAFKKTCKAATLGNITLSGLQTIDTISLIANDRCLVKNQTSSQTNGIYAVQSGAWTRVAGADIASEIAAAVVAVDSGTQGGSHWLTTFKTTDTLGTTPMPWYNILDSSNIDDGLSMMGGF